MSLILKGIDMPSEGEDVTIEINSSGYVRAYSTIPMVYDHDIRAIQIPKGHGRIIDEREAIENVACFHGTAWLDTDEIEPILEAEGEER